MKRIAWAGLILAGCAPVAPSGPPPLGTGPVPPVASTVPGDTGAAVEGDTATCRTDAVADMIGKPLTVGMSQEALGKLGKRTVRVIGPGTAVTMDYRPDRLNIEVDAGNNVVRFRCG